MFLEVFIFDFDQDIYGQELIVEFIEFIRPDKQFSDVDGLLAQMESDCGQIKELLAGFAESNPVAIHPLGALQAKGEL